MDSELAFVRPDEQTLEVRLGGDWCLQSARPSPRDVTRELEARPARRVLLSARELTSWDTGLLTFVQALGDECRSRSVPLDRAGLPEGVLKLLALAEAVPEVHTARRAERAPGWVGQLGTLAIEQTRGCVDFLEFLGQVTLAFGRFVSLRARYQARDLWLFVQQCGAEALPIVALISFLVGLILAFVGAVQLRQFGAQVYVADLVGLGMVREMGALMTGIIMAGRTGAAFAAQLGTMRVNEEVDALQTLGISPIEYLVLPRVLALALMLPLLCVFADLIGILGGGVVGIGIFHIEPTEYFLRTLHRITLNDFLVGVVKSAVFGVLVALAGCLRGLRASGSASAVGQAATSAVVTGIVAIVCADGLFAVLSTALGI